MKTYSPTKERLLEQAAGKPVRKLLQYDVFFHEEVDDIFRPDKDGDCVFNGWTYELRNTDCLRVTVPEGAPAADVIRGLEKIIQWIKKSPDDLKGEKEYL